MLPEKARALMTQDIISHEAKKLDSIRKKLIETDSGFATFSMTEIKGLWEAYSGSLGLEFVSIGETDDEVERDITNLVAWIESNGKDRWDL